MDEPPFALVCGWRYPLLIIAKGGSFSTVSTLRLYSSTSIACGFLYKRNRAFPTGNALLYISLSYVDFSGCFLRGAPCFCFVQRANCAITYYNPAQPSKCLYYTTICATFLLNAHLSGCQNYRAFLSERLRLLCQKIPDTLCSRPRNNYIRLNSALVHAIPF